MDFIDEMTSLLGASSVTFLGAGSFGTTYRVDGLDGRQDPVAVKVLKFEHFNSRLFARETEHLTDFDHDNIVRLHGIRSFTVQGQELHAIVCEFIDGGSVGQVVRLHGLPTYAQVSEFAEALLGAVAEMHSKDKIHRDLKPENVLLRQGDWKHPVIIDFGLVRSLSGNTMTAYPALVGSIPWMAPEQLQGEKARKACDIWASGVILYQLLTGRHPFLHGVDIQTLEPSDLVELVSVPPSALPEDVPKPLSETVMRLLTPEPANARGSAKRALRDLREAN